MKKDTKRGKKYFRIRTKAETVYFIELQFKEIYSYFNFLQKPKQIMNILPILLKENIYACSRP